MLKGGLNARLNALGVAPPKIEKGPKSAPKFFSDSFQFLAELRVLQPPLCIKKPLCEAVLRVLAGSCTQKSTPFHIFSFFMKTHSVVKGRISSLSISQRDAAATALSLYKNEDTLRAKLTEAGFQAPEIDALEMCIRDSPCAYAGACGSHAVLWPASHAHPA